MADEDSPLPPDDWLKSSGAKSTELPRHIAPSDERVSATDTARDALVAAAEIAGNDFSTAAAVPAAGTTLDDAFRQAEMLAPLDRLRLAARLWMTLLPVHRAALVHFQWERFSIAAAASSVNAGQVDDPATAATAAPYWLTSGVSERTLWHLLFDHSHTSGLYSAPRRFDLATIFVVTGAYSVLLGVMSILNFVPAAKIIIGLLLAFVAVVQSVYHERANPRGVSVVAGSIGYALISFVLWLIGPRWFPDSFLFVVVINGLIGGAILGYIAGVLVGGMFLAADMLRTKAWQTPRESAANASGDPFAAESNDGESAQSSPWQSVVES